MIVNSGRICLYVVGVGAVVCKYPTTYKTFQFPNLVALQIVHLAKVMAIAGAIAALSPAVKSERHITTQYCHEKDC